MNIYLLCIVIFLTGVSAETLLPETGTSKFKANNFSLRTDNGDVRITSGKSAGWSYTIVGDKSNCRIRKTENVTRFTLESTKKKSSGPECMVNWSIQLRPKTRLSLHGGVTDMTIVGMTHSADIHVGTGNVVLRSPLTKLNFRGGRASIHTHGLAGSSTIRVGNGDVALKWTTKPTSQNIGLRIGMGSVAIKAPVGTVVNVDEFKSPTFGVSRSIGLGQGHPANLTLSGKMGMGNLEVTPN